MTGSVAWALGEPCAGALVVPADERPEDDRALGAGGLGVDAEVVPLFGLDDERALGGLPLGRGHAGTVVAAYVIDQHLRGRVDHIRGEGHGRSLAVETADCLRSCVRSAHAVMCAEQSLNSTKARSRLLQQRAGLRDNRVLGVTAVTHTLASVATNVADDVTYAVLCGACPESAGEHYSCYAVTYETADLDGEPTGERLFTCRHGLADSLEWAIVHNRSFVPPSIARLTPYCPHCGAAWFDCTTNFRGLCIKSEVAA